MGRIELGVVAETSTPTSDPSSLRCTPTSTLSKRVSTSSDVPRLHEVLPEDGVLPLLPEKEAPPRKGRRSCLFTNLLPPLPLENPEVEGATTEGCVEPPLLHFLHGVFFLPEKVEEFLNQREEKSVLLLLRQVRTLSTTAEGKRRSEKGFEESNLKLPAIPLR